MFGHLGTSAQHLLFNFTDNQEQSRFNAFIKIRQLEVVEDLRRTAMQRGHTPQALRRTFGFFESP
jgi:hypothetical protein